ncbi:Fur family transcriptional regulator [Clostridium thermarum]|uniref:Fur family transcriptional regulator n=1 Tax=Clostridium thermarum TaxID=1716543 RepID=UPI001123908B|nr:Fur family transcriptional regulator [Clostridium thermarum]
MTNFEILKSKKLKITLARKVIFEILNDADAALSAEYIYDKCVERDNSINLSTVYRTLEVFQDTGIVEKFDLGDRRYSYSIKKEHHKHTIECSLCHKSIELDCPVKMLEEIIKTKTGFTMMEHELRIKGICEKCKKVNKQII